MDAAMRKQRWSEAFADRTGAAFAQIVSLDLALEGSIFARPLHGQDTVRTVVITASDIYDTLALTAEAQGDRRVYLEWTTEPTSYTRLRLADTELPDRCRRLARATPGSRRHPAHCATSGDADRSPSAKARGQSHLLGCGAFAPVPQQCSQLGRLGHRAGVTTDPRLNPSFIAFTEVPG